MGPLQLRMQEGRLSGIYFENHHPAPGPTDGVSDAAPFHSAVSQLEEYFCGRRREFDVPLASFAGTEFQQQVWQRLCNIPWGQTTTYLAIAEHLGRPGAVRAVGGAVARNPISIIVPCHRVLGANGAITGFAGGLPRKIKLLELEGRQIAATETGKSKIPA